MRRLVRSVVLLAATLGAALPVGAQERPWEWGMHPMWGVWGVAMMAAMLAFWGLVIAGIVLAIRWIAGERRRPATDRALEILRERYARGEIGKEEFEARRRDLEAA